MQKLYLGVITVSNLNTDMMHIFLDSAGLQLEAINISDLPLTQIFINILRKKKKRHIFYACFYIFFSIRGIQ